MNKLFLTAITGECCLFYLHGIKPRGYNPFTLLRQNIKAETGEDLPKSQSKCLIYLAMIYTDNKLELHPLLKQIVTISERKGKRSYFCKTKPD